MEKKTKKLLALSDKIILSILLGPVVIFIIGMILLYLSVYYEAIFLSTPKAQGSLIYAIDNKKVKEATALLKRYSFLRLYKKHYYIEDTHIMSVSMASYTHKEIDPIFYKNPEFVKAALHKGLKFSDLRFQFENIMQNASIQDYRFFIRYIILHNSYNELSYHKSKPNFYKEGYFDKSYNFKFEKALYAFDRFLVSSFTNPILMNIIHYLFYKKIADYNKITQLYNYYKKQAFLGAIRGFNLKLATYLLKEEGLSLKNYTKNDLSALIKAVLKSKEPVKTLEFLKSIGVKINLSKEINQNAFYLKTIR